ncbi:metallophosphoesterase [Neomicrococcus lactis]
MTTPSTSHRLAKALVRTTGALALSGTAGLAYGLWEKNQFKVRQETVPVLPADYRDLTVLHISDIHFIPGQAKKKRWLAELADLSPDVVINTGDNLSHPEAVPALLDALEPLMRFPGVFVPGSNCYFAPKLKNPLRYFKGPSSLDGAPPKDLELPWRDMHRGFEDAGWLNATNATFTAEIAGQQFDFSGVDDPHLGYEKYAGWPAEGSPLENDDAASPSAVRPRIALAHAPYQRVLNYFTESGADMVLAGHTHGGQVCVPGYGALVSNCDLPTSQARGLSTWSAGTAATRRTIPLEVSAGIGTSRFAPIRVACRPEAVLLRLTARAA